jgi:Brp/Blh family beta-carotene 15,15'-monooxygenase
MRHSTWLRAHTIAALILTLAAMALWLTVPAPGEGARLAVLAGLVAVLGLPHGAVDHLQGRDLLARRYGGTWTAVFAGGYTLAAAAVIGAWIAWPPALLIAFLAIAVVHFGGEDTAASPLTSRHERFPTALIEPALRGALPVLLPITFHPGTTGAHFAALLPATPGATVAQILHTLTPAGWVYLAAIGGLAAAALARRNIYLALELTVLTATFAVLPPLIAFVVYFCVWHAPRHSLTIIATHGPAHLGAGIAWFTRSALPLTLVTIAIALVAWGFLHATSGAGSATLQVVFIGLAALTVPHVVLASWHQASAKRI